jgi:hypothetical protein
LQLSEGRQSEGFEQASPGTHVHVVLHAPLAQFAALPLHGTPPRSLQAPEPLHANPGAVEQFTVAAPTL